MSQTECQTYFRPVLEAYSGVERVVYLYQPRCKLWRCPYCATLNKQQWCVRIADGIRIYQEEGISQWNFVTITSSPKLKTLAQTMYVWPQAWAKLSRRMRYHFPGIRYVLLPEQHKDGRLHIHAIASGGLDTKWLKRNCPTCGLGYMAESDIIAEAWQSIQYVTKYLTKSSEDGKWPARFRRIRTSQGWPELQTEESWPGHELDWVYLTSYPSEGLDYLAEGLAEKKGVPVRVLRESGQAKVNPG